MSDDTLRASLRIDTTYPRFSEDRRNPTRDDVISAVERVTSFKPVYAQELVNRVSDPRLRESMAMKTRRRGTLSLAIFNEEPRLDLSFLSVHIAESMPFKVEAQLSYRFANTISKGTTATVKTAELTEQFLAMLRCDLVWRNGLAWEPEFPSAPPLPPQMFLKIDSSIELVQDRWRDPTAEKIVSVMRNLKHTGGAGPIVHLTDYAQESSQLTESVFAIKLSNVDFSLYYERDSKEDPAAHKCTLVPLTTKQIIEVFLSFLRRDNNWKYSLPWSPPFGPQQVVPSSQPAVPGTASTGVVYLLRAGSHYKIGKTTDPQSRYETLDIQLPWKPERIHEIATNNIHRLERHWHRYFADRRANGEWFNLTTEDVEEFRAYTRVDYK
jgi:hypothetical protein